MKLELKHLAPYLPYGLKIHTYDDDGRGLTQSIKNISIHAGNHIGVESSEGWDLDITLPDFRPILRPLSDLTKEVFHKSERLIPMVRLLEMGERHTFSKDDLIKSCSVNVPVNIIECKAETYSDTNIYQVTYAVKTSNMGTLVYSFSYDDRFDRFSKRDETREITLGVGYQLHLFQKLFEWHFDVFGLIPAGLAIDINTLDQNP